MIAAIYARKSTEQNGVADDAKSVTRQIEYARAYAARKGWASADEHIYLDDGISGAEFERRPELVQLLNALKPRPPFQVLLVSDRDRLGREQIETSYILKQIIRAGVRVIECKGNEGREITLSSPTDKVIMAVEDFAAEVERDKARQRTYSALVRKAQRGLVAGGKLYGYAHHRTPEGVKRVVNESQAEVIRRIFTLYADGAGLGTIAQTLNADGVPGLRGTWNFTALRETIRNETYRGVVVWNRSRKRDVWGVKKPSGRDASEWIRVEASELRIVDETLWDRVQQRIRQNGETYARGANGKLIARPARSDWDSPYLLSGFAKCGVCGGPVIVSTQRSGSAKKTFLRCANRWKRGTAVCANTMTVRAELLDAGVLEALEEVLDQGLISAAIERALTQLRACEDHEDRRAAVEKELAAITARERNLAEAIARGEAPEAVVSLLKQEQARRKRLEGERAGLAERGRLATLTTSEVAKELSQRVADLRGLLVTAFVPKVRQLFRALEASFTIQPAPTDDGRRGIRLVLNGSYAKVCSGADIVPNVVAPTGFEPVFQP